MRLCLAYPGNPRCYIEGESPHLWRRTYSLADSRLGEGSVGNRVRLNLSQCLQVRDQIGTFSFIGNASERHTYANNVTLRVSKISIQRRLIPHKIGAHDRSTVPKVVECSRPAPDDANQGRTLVGALGVEFVADNARLIDDLAPGRVLCPRAQDPNTK